jgi:Phosphate-selective porin O and P
MEPQIPTERQNDGRGMLSLLVVLLSVLPSFRLVGQGQGRVEVFGYVQPRFEVTGDSGVFLLRRARLGVQGSITPWASYRIQADFRSWEAGGPPAVTATDLWILLSGRRVAGQFGQYKTSFLYENMISSSVHELPDRTVASELDAPFRDIGAQVTWTPNPRFALVGAVMNGEGPNVTDNPDKRMMYVQRATVTPTRGVTVGAAGAEKPDTTRWTVDGQLVRGAFLARVAYLGSHRRSSDSNGRAWYALAGYTIRPRRAQLLARVEQYDPSDAIAGDRTRGYTLGAQIFFRGDDLKLQASYAFYDEQGTEIKNNKAVVQMQVRF